jgi:chromosome segregation ATPase
MRDLQKKQEYKTTKSRREIVKMDQMDEQINFMKKDLDYFRNLNQEYKFKIEDLQDQLKRNSERKSTLEDQSKIDRLEMENMRLASNLKFQENQMRQTQNNFDKLVVELEQQESDKSTAFDSLQKKEQMIEKYKSKLISNMNSHDNYKEQVIKLENQNMVLKKEVYRLRLLEHQNSNKNDSLLKTYKKLYDDMRNEKQLYIDKITQLTNRLKSANSHVHIQSTDFEYKIGRKLIKKYNF